MFGENIILNFHKINHKVGLCFLEKNQENTMKMSSLVSVLLFPIIASSLENKILYN